MNQRGDSRNHDIYDRLGSVEKHGQNLETRVGAIEETQKLHGTKLDQIMAAVSGRRDFDPLRILQVIVFIVGLAAAGGTAITYVSSTTNAGRIAVLEFQTKEMWSAGRWTLNSQNVTRALKQDAAQ